MHEIREHEGIEFRCFLVTSKFQTALLFFITICANKSHKKAEPHGKNGRMVFVSKKKNLEKAREDWNFIGHVMAQAC